MDTFNIRNFFLSLFFIVGFLLTASSFLNAQIKANFSLIYGLDFYQRMVNPSENNSFDRSAGSALLNLTLGPRVTVGGSNFSVSIESQGNIGLLGFNVQEYKGLGTLSVPILARLNFKGLSQLNNNFSFGNSFAGGIQYNKTELYGVTNKFKTQGLKRKFFPVYVLEYATGMGFKSATVEIYIRGGWNPQTKANSLNLGINLVYSLVHKIDRSKFKNFAPSDDSIYRM